MPEHGTARPVWGRRIRLAVAAAAVLVAVAFYGPRLTHVVTAEARLNAPLAPVSSPIAGRLVTSPPVVGATVVAGTRLAHVVDVDASRAAVERLDIEVEAAAANLAALKEENRRLGAMAASLSAASGRHLRAQRANLAVREQEAMAELDAARAAAALATRSLERVRTLARRNATSAHSLDEAEARALRAAAERRAVASRLERLRQERAALDDGVYLGEGYDDVPYSRQRADEVRLRISDLMTRVVAAEQRLAGLEHERARKLSRSEGEWSAELVAPADGVVWRSDFAAGDTGVERGEGVGLIVCAERLVTASLPTRTAERLRPGTTARIRLVGAERWYDAEVTELRAMGADRIADRWAAPLPSTAVDQLLVSLRPRALPETDAATFCDVGRKVEVRIATSTTRRFERWFAGAVERARGVALSIGRDEEPAA